jgi:signal transduction histidine kinase
MSQSIRTRLTLWYAAVLAVVLAGFAVALYVVHARSRIADLDDDLARSGGLVARAMAAELADGLPNLEAAREVLGDMDLPGDFLAFFDASGTLIDGRWYGLPRRLERGWAERASLSIETPSGRLRLHVSRGGAGFHVGVARSLEGLDVELAALRRSLALGVALGFLLAALGGGWIARGALRPLEDMAAQTRGISDRTPGARLKSPNPDDELGRLAAAFNALLARLESALAQQRRFMADASHELRTPVSVARTAIDVTLGRVERSAAEYQDALQVVREQMRRLTRIVEDLFTLARSDAAPLPLDLQPVYLEEIVGECVADARLLGQSADVRIEWRGSPEVACRGDERWLRQMLMNLLDNAVRHAATGGRVLVELSACEAAVLTVADDGKGIPEAERERIFERFVRLDPARGGEGTGLGLPIARAIAEAHGGRLTLARSDGFGSCFEVRLPLASGHA